MTKEKSKRGIDYDDRAKHQLRLQGENT